MAKTRSEPVSHQSEFRTRPKPVPKIGEAGIEPLTVFEENVDDSFNRVADFEEEEEVEIPIMIVQPKTLKIPQKGERQKRKRIETPVG